MWRLRKFYGGQGGALPPTDPRILAMTEQQINLEFAHIIEDMEERKKDSNAEVYVDEEYEKEEAEEELRDSKLYFEDTFEDDLEEEHYTDMPLPKSENNKEDEWVDVEIDDDEDFGKEV